MPPISYARHQFPPVLIQHAVWLYLRFTLSYRDVEDLLAERGVDVSYETVRRWVLKFGPLIARRLRRAHPKPSRHWHLDEMVARIAGETVFLGRRACSPSPAFLPRECANGWRHGGSWYRVLPSRVSTAYRR
jgi:transposase-like protein